MVVVDDDLDMVEFLHLLLSSRGVDGVVCSDFSDAAELIRCVLPSLVLLDLRGPPDRRAGLRVLDQLRADDATAATPVVLITSDHLALERHAGRLEALRARPLPKPVDVDQVMDAIGQAVAWCRSTSAVLLAYERCRTPCLQDTFQCIRRYDRLLMVQ